MSQTAKPIPEGYRTLTPYLVLSDAAAAIEFYTRAFGARELFRMPGPGGRVMHAELEIGDSRLMLSEENPGMGSKSAKTLGGTPVSLFVYVPDVDATFNRAVSAGATVRAPVADMFWGDRWGALTDPFGQDWQIATHTEDVTEDEMARRAAAAMASSGVAG
jgi:PhnB protein